MNVFFNIQTRINYLKIDLRVFSRLKLEMAIFVHLVHWFLCLFFLGKYGTHPIIELFYVLLKIIQFVHFYAL